MLNFISFIVLFVTSLYCLLLNAFHRDLDKWIEEPATKYDTKYREKLVFAPFAFLVVLSCLILLFTIYQSPQILGLLPLLLVPIAGLTKDVLKYSVKEFLRWVNEEET